MNEMKDMKFCQSCGMPMEAENYATEADGTQNADYCQFCYKDGQFTPETRDMDMQGMIDACAPYMVTDDRTEEQARGMMAEFFPTLKRWKQ